MAEEIIGGYRLANLMATGHTSQIWEVVEVSSHRHFAMKLLLPEKVSSAEHRRFLTHEAMVGKKLAHPNVIKIFHFSKNPKNPYFVMEFFPAGSLKLRIMRKQQDFLNAQVYNILKKTATGLAYMNASGWVHRDVKPDNILVNAAGEVRIIDFALALRVQKSNFLTRFMSKWTKVHGTRSYMSPEQILGQPLDGRADIYSFAASAYEILTGRPPFRGLTGNDLLRKHLVEKPESPQVYNPELTDEISDLILRCLQKKKENRPRDFHEVLMALRSLRIFKNDPVPVDETGGM